MSYVIALIAGGLTGWYAAGKRWSFGKTLLALIAVGVICALVLPV